MFLHADCETTGLNVPGVPSDDPRQPHMASISAVLDDENGQTQHILSTLVNPEGRYRLEDYPEAFKIHGITTAQAERYGMPLRGVIVALGQMAASCATFSAFNMFYDHKIIKIGCARMEGTDDDRKFWRDIFENMEGICSMESAANHLIGKKRISLANAHMDLFKVQARSGQYHGSMEDVMAHRRIFYHLKAANALLPAKPLKREYDTPYQGGTPTGAVGSTEVQV